MLRYFWNRRRQEGFTLIELLVVVAIIALLAAFAVPRLFEAINKSKNAQADADLPTITAALERYYMDSSAFPTDITDLNGQYLKSSTTFKNGFGKGYLYASDGSYYAFIDVDNQSTGATTILTLTCGSHTATWTYTAAAAAAGVVTTTSNAITAADIEAGNCALTGQDTSVTEKIVTN